MVDPGMNSGVAHIHVVDGIEKVFSALSSELVALSTEWKFLMRRLDLTNEDLVEIDTQYKNDGPREVIYQCMLRWHSRVGEAASVVKLVRALRQERLHRVADLIKTYTVRIPCTRCPTGGHEPSCYQATPVQLTRQKTKIKMKQKQKFPSSIPKLPKLYSPNSSIGSLNSSRRSSGGSTSSRSSTKKSKPTKRRSRTMSCDSTTSITSSNPADDEDNGSEDEKEDVPEVPEHVEIPEKQPAPLEDSLPPTPPPEVKKAPPTEKPRLEPVKETPKEVEKQDLQERVVTGHLRVEELIPEGGIPPNFTDLFKDMCAHLYKTVVKQAEDNIRALEEIVKLKNFFVRHLVVGSVIISMSCNGDTCYGELKEMYKSGELLRACQRVFGRENLLQHHGIHYVRYSLFIDEFEDEDPPQEELIAAPEEEEKTEEPEVEKEGESVNEETPEKPKQEKTIMVTVEVCAKLTASIDTDIPTSSLLQSFSETGYREANARKYYKTITRDDVMNDAIEKMNTLASIPGLKFTRLDLKKDRVDVVMTCSSRKAINDAYSFFLKKKLLNVCNETLLTKKIKKLAGEELIQLELEIQDTHITKCEKQFKERLTKMRLNRNEERDSAHSQGRGISNNWQKARTVIDSMKREKSVISPPSGHAQGRGTSVQNNWRKAKTVLDSMKREKSVISPPEGNTSSRRSSGDNSRKNSTGSTR